MEIIPKSISRRKFIGATLLAAAAMAGAEGKCLEPTWLKVRRVRLGAEGLGLRLVHFSDLHHKGNRAYLQSVVDEINALKPDFACFTGDLVESRQFLPETLEILSCIKVPLYGVPGNHDYWSRISFAPVIACFNATGGAWLLLRPEDIRLDTVLKAVHGCAHLGLAPRGAPGCPVGERIPRQVVKAMKAADEAVTERLSHITVADLLAAD